VKYDRQALIAAAELALDEEKQHHEKQVAEQAETFKQAKAQWMATHGEEWLAALTRLRRQLRDGRPIRESDLPGDGNRHGYRRTATFDVATPRPLADYQPSRELTSLIRLLGTVVDAQVTSAALQEIGVSRAALRDVVAKLAPNTIRT
jgi:hypothetical protein